jgi:hypothetical protein
MPAATPTIAWTSAWWPRPSATTSGSTAPATACKTRRVRPQRRRRAALRGSDRRRLRYRRYLLLRTTTTADDVNGNAGWYLFDGLDAGVDYIVRFVRPVSYDFSPQ